MDGAKVLVTIFSDYQCPHCRAAHETYRSLIAKYSVDPGVRFVLRHFPLEGECNSYAPNGGHSAACEAAAAVVLARKTGKVAKMNDWLFDNQEKLTPLLRLKYHDSIADAVAAEQGALRLATSEESLQ